MKKLISIMLSMMIMFTALFGLQMFAGAAAVKDKSKIKPGDVIDVIKYDCSEGTFEYGTMLAKNHTPTDGTDVYIVLDEKTFKAGENYTAPEVTKQKLKLIKDTCIEVLNDPQYNIIKQNFGRIDSESYKYSVTVAPKAVPMLEKRGLSESVSIWLAMGNRNGDVDDVYMSATFEDEQEDETEEITVKVVVPRRMSIRLEDGTILKNGDTLKAKIGEEIKYQMCSNNWDNDIYDDNGNGIAGTVVYRFKVSNKNNERSYDADSHSFVLPKGDPVMRTDVNKCFMAYRYYFKKGNYNKQTGIVNVVNTPIESLSVNLPLGSTIKSDAYKAFSQIDSANVFIETGADKAESYKDYIWNY